jgi:hypothetical protein
MQSNTDSNQPATQEPSLDEFRPTEGGGESANDAGLLVAAYVLFWLVLFAFIAQSWNKQRALDRRLAKLEAQVGGDAAKSS